MCAVDGATCSGVGRNRSGGGLRRCASGLLAVESCAGNAVECTTAVPDRVSQRTGVGVCSERDNTEV